VAPRPLLALLIGDSGAVWVSQAIWYWNKSDIYPTPCMGGLGGLAPLRSQLQKSELLITREKKKKREREIVTQ